MPRLVVEKGVDKGKSIAVGERGAVIVGRDTSAGITINDTMASRNHFKVEARTGAYVLVDLNSKNGTLLNGSRVKESRIAAGDRIQVGETVFSFMDDVKPKEEMVGRIVGGGRYKIIDRIGRGGMGTVYKAEQIRLNRNVALKMLQQELVGDPTFIKKFLDEARAAAQFNHPNVVTIYEIDVANDMQPPVPFIAMEYLPGGSVQDLLSREKKLPPDRALAVILDAARGLEYAEKKQIVHRDIKPDNLMISEDGRIKIGDLGLAKQLKAEGARPEAPEGVFGTPHYIAPEQALNKPLDIRADIYALGATFYRILAGTTPYQGSSAKEIVVSKLREDPPSLEATDPSLPKVLTAIVDKMMKRDPAQRHTTAKELVTELDRARREVVGSMTGPLSLGMDGSSSSSSNTATAMGGEARRSATPIVVLTGAAAMLIVTVAVVAAVLIKSNANKEQPQPGPGPVVENGQNAEEREKLANEALGNAESFEKQQTMSDPEAIRKIIDEYGKIVKRYAGTEAEKKAQAQVDFYQRHLNTLAADAVFASAERHEVAYGTARKQFGQDKAKYEDVKREALAAMQGFAEFIEKFADDERVKAAKDKSAAIDVDFSALRRNGDTWRAEEQAIRELFAQKAFGDADARIAAAEKATEFRDYASAVRKLRTDLRNEADKAYDQLDDQVTQKRKDNDFPGARKLIEEGRAWGYAELKERWDTLAGAIDRFEGEFRGAEEKKERDAQVAILREGKVRAIDAARSRFQFTAAQAVVEAVLPKLKDKDLADEARLWIDDCKSAAALHQTFLQRVADGKLKTHPVAHFSKVHMDGEISSATPDSVTITLEGRVQVKVWLRDVAFDEFRAVMRLWDHDFDDARRLVEMDVLLGMKELDGDLSLAEKEAAGGHKPELEALRKRAEWAKGQAESEASDRFDQAKEEMKREKWQRAIDDLNQIATRLNSTKYYADHRASIDALQDECKDKLKK